MNHFISGWILFTHDMRLRYRRAALGFFWLFLPPAAGILSSFFILAPLARNSHDSAAFGSIHIVINILLFQSFNEALTLPSQMLRRSRTLLAETALAPACVLIAAVYQCLFLTLMRVPVLIFAEFVIAHHFGWGWASAAAASCLLLLWGLIPGSFLAPFSLILFDVRFAMPLFQGLFLIITPVLYHPGQQGLLFDLQRWNPLSFLTISGQSAIMHSGQPVLTSPIIFIMGAGILLLIRSVYFFNKASRRIPETL